MLWRIHDYSPGKRLGWKSLIRVIHQTQPFTKLRIVLFSARLYTCVYVGVPFAEILTLRRFCDLFLKKKCCRLISAPTKVNQRLNEYSRTFREKNTWLSKLQTKMFIFGLIQSMAHTLKCTKLFSNPLYI